MPRTLKSNIGTVDRFLRIGVGLGCIYFCFYSPLFAIDKFAAFVLCGMGCFSMIMAIIGYCPLYTLIGFSTAKVDTRQIGSKT